MKILQAFWRHLGELFRNHRLQAIAILVIGILAGAPFIPVIRTAIAQEPVVPTNNKPAISANSSAAGDAQPAIASGLVDAYWHIPGQVFLPTETDSSLIYNYDFAGCITAQWSSTGFQYPLNLPTGSIIKSVDVFFRNASAASQQFGNLYLKGYNGLGNFTSTIVASTLPGNQTGTGYFSNSSGLVSIALDFYTNSYVMIWLPGGTDQALCGVRIYYAGPAGFSAYIPNVSR